MNADQLAATLACLRREFRQPAELAAHDPSPQRLAQLARDTCRDEPGRFLEAVGELVSAGKFRVDPAMIVAAYLHLHGSEQ